MSRVQPPCPILYEDNHLLVVEKPVNVLSQADDTGDNDLLTMLKTYIKEAYEKPGNVYLGLVHRLDRPVGGAMVFAKTSKAASRLSDQVRTHKLQKTYEAIVHGKPTRAADTRIDYLWKDAKSNTSKVVDANNKDGKRCELSYNTIASNDTFSRIQIQLKTGRPHQIRVQLAHMGCPLFGDQKYGQAVNKPGQQLALWATTLRFEHPVTKEFMTFQSNPPGKSPWDLESKKADSIFGTGFFLFVNQI